MTLPTGGLVTTIDDLGDESDGVELEYPLPDLRISDAEFASDLRTSGTTTSPGASDEDN